MTTPSQKDKDVKRILVIEGLANLIMLVAKVAVGLTTGSLAILGDAIHSLSDVTNNIIAYSVIRLSGAPPDREHPYGHRKFETLAVFFLAALLTVLAFELAISAINKEDTVIVSSPVELAIMLAVLAINISIATWERIWARRLDSEILLADATHTFADILTTVVVIVGWQLSAMGYLWLDRLCAFAVSIIILYFAFNLFKRVAPVLIDQSAIDPELLSISIKKISGVREVKRVRSRWIGSDKAIDIIISVAHDLSTDDSHNIASQVEQLIEKDFGVTDISIHVEPFDT